MEEEKRICTHCGEVLEEDEGTIVDEEILCDDCVNDCCIACDRCGEVIWAEESETDNDIYLCQDCFDNHYNRCECCERIIRNDDTSWHNNVPYCYSCYDEVDNDYEIEEYGYKPDPIFYGDSYLYFGVELEVDDGGKDGENACTLKNIANSCNEHIYIKSDSSIYDGFEIVSHPMTLDYHMNTMNWESVLYEAVEMNYKSHDTSTCGLHIHVNRDAFGINQSEQEEIISRILFFVEKHWNEIFRFSRRTEINMNRWSCRLGMEKSGKEILDKVKDCGNRYVAVNLRNYSTVEFRLFRGTLRYNTFIATLQFVSEICRVALTMSEEEIDSMSWSEFVRSVRYDELIQYLKERRLYVNEEIFTEEEV
ncbi:MAG: amidoligase family protein [Lachnospiraceae bacterium]|nr:amidoligase family protein [Lachnospiraceae bacterium]